MYGIFRFGTRRYATITEAQAALALEGSLLEFLTGVVDVAVYPDHIPQTATLPCISYWLVSRVHVHNLDGAAGVAQARIQIDVWSHSKTEADRYAKDLRIALDGYRGTMTDVDVMGVVYEDRNVFYEAPEDGSDFGTFHIALDFIFHYRVTIPVFPFVYGETTEDDITPEEVLYTILTAAPSITAPVYPLHRPQTSSLPCIVYSVEGETRAPGLTGKVGAVDARIKLSFFSTIAGDASALQESVRLVLDGNRGTFGEMFVGAILLDDDSGSYVQPGEGSDVGTFVRESVYRVLYRETIPE